MLYRSIYNKPATLNRDTHFHSCVIDEGLTFKFDPVGN